jgi:hypothetical protein
MKINDITANPNINFYTPQSTRASMKSLPSSSELMVYLILQSLEKPSGKAAEAAKSDKVNIIT